MGNPQILPGTVNRLRASVLWTDFPQLNVTPPFMGKDMISLSFDGESTAFIPAAVGVVTSAEPYLIATFTMALLRTQALANAYKRQWELQALLGAATIRGDSAAMDVWNIVNCAIQSVAPLKFSGEEAVYPVTCKGTYYLNNSLWDAA
jgi:hypothetical protein